MTAPVSVAVVGLGKVAQLHHLPNVAASPRAELTVVCDLSQDLATAIAGRYGLPPSGATTDLADVLDREIDAVVVANRHHAPIVTQTLEAGRHVFVEKPVCWGLDEAAALVHCERQAGRTVVVGYMKRFDPAFERIAADRSDPGSASSPYFARLHAFAGGRHRHERPDRTLKPVDLSREQIDAEGRVVADRVAATLGEDDPYRVAAVRTLAELAIHVVNLAQALLGPLTVEAARSFPTPFGTGYAGMMRAGGIPVSLEVVPDFETARDWDEDLTLYNPSGSTQLRFGSPFGPNTPTMIHERVAVGTEATVRDVLVSRESSYRREIEHFIDCVLGQATPRTTIAEAVSDLAVVYELARALVPL